MSDRVGVLNLALMELGQPAMSGPSDTSSWVKKLTAQYEHVVKALLSSYDWNFAQRREQLAIADSYIGEQGARAYVYKKPATWLRTVRINDSGDALDDNDDPATAYDDEDGVIKSDLTPCWMWHVSADWLTKEGAWPELFAYAVAMRLAWIGASTTTMKEDTKDRLEKQAARALQKAKSWDAQQKPRRRTPEGDWMRSRRGFGSSYRSRTGSDIS